MANDTVLLLTRATSAEGQTMNQGYDIVGDIHGHAEPLHRLLEKLGYREHEGVFRHREREMIFVGDFIDRGPQQREVLRIARAMCEAGAAMAVMGNHEFNAIGWVTQNKDGAFLRCHSAKSANQHTKFLRQIEEDSADHKDAVSWFRSLPVWLDLPDLRVVHACWHEPSRAALMPFLDEAGRFTEEGILESYRHGSDAHAAVEILLKGPEERLPAGIHFFDKDGHKRQEVRLRWWDQDATTFQKAALGMDGQEDEIPDSKLPRDYRYHESKPVFFGHYWLKDNPGITAPNAACLDFSVANEGYLSAYRWSGENKLTEGSLVSVPA
jgi:Calcineurin-like phosphoesterase